MVLLKCIALEVCQSCSQPSLINGVDKIIETCEYNLHEGRMYCRTVVLDCISFS